MRSTVCAEAFADIFMSFQVHIINRAIFMPQAGACVIHVHVFVYACVNVCVCFSVTDQKQTYFYFATTELMYSNVFYCVHTVYL